jgi:hypothetical protein
MKQMAKGLAAETKTPTKADSEPAAGPKRELDKELQSLKWNPVRFWPARRGQSPKNSSLCVHSAQLLSHAEFRVDRGLFLR